MQFYVLLLSIAGMNGVAIWDGVWSWVKSESVYVPKVSSSSIRSLIDGIMEVRKIYSYHVPFRAKAQGYQSGVVLQEQLFCFSSAGCLHR